MNSNYFQHISWDERRTVRKLSMSGLESVEVAKELDTSATIAREGKRLSANAYHALGLVIMSWLSVSSLARLTNCQFEHARDMFLCYLLSHKNVIKIIFMGELVNSTSIMKFIRFWI